jgi:hypothetical protein
MLLEISKFNLGDILNVYLKRESRCNEDYMRLISDGYRVIYNYKEVKENLLEAGVIDTWLEMIRVGMEADDLG